MAWNFGSIVAAQLRFLVTTINKKNYKAAVAEAHHLIELYGQDAYICLLRCLVEDIDFRDHKGQKDAFKLQFLAQELLQLPERANFPSVVVRMFGDNQVAEEYLANFSKVLKFTFAQQVALGLGMSQHSDVKFSQEGKKFLKSTLLVLEKPIGNLSLPLSLLHNLLHFLSTVETLWDLRVVVLKNLQLLNNSSEQSLVLAPLILDNVKSANSKRNYQEEISRQGGADPNQLLTAVNSSLGPAEILRELGYTSTSSNASLKDILGHFNNLSEVDVAKVLGMMMRTLTGLEDSLSNGPGGEKDKDPGGPNTWNVDVFVDVLRDLFPKLSWRKVATYLDHPGFEVLDHQCLLFLLKVYQRATKEPFPMDIIFNRWRNLEGQFSLLKAAMSSPPDVINLAQSLHRQTDYKGVVPPGCQCWLSLDLVKALVEIGESDLYPAVRGLFDQAIRLCPDLVLFGLSQVTTEFGLLHQELCSELVPAYLNNYPGTSAVLHHLWQVNKQLVIRGMVDMYCKDPTTLSRTLDITQELKALPQVLDARPFSFTVDLAALASRREFLNLEKWVTTHVADHKENFARACVHFLRHRLKDSTDKMKASTVIPLVPDAIHTFVKCLEECASRMPSDLAEEIRQLEQIASGVLGSHARYQHGENAAGASPPVSIPEGPVTNPQEGVFSSEIEEEANGYFQKIYTGQQSIESVVDMLKQFKSSTNQREQEIFHCMIHNLFDEYRFFPKYPDKELRITGILFGSLIQHQLVSSITLGIALRYVLDALRNKPGSKMYKFGLFALDQFKPRLPEWQQYCAQLTSIPHLSQTNPEIVKYIDNLASSGGGGAGGGGEPAAETEAVVKQPEPAAKPRPASQPPSANASPVQPAVSPAIAAQVQMPKLDNQPSFATTLNIDTLLVASDNSMQLPDETIMDKIHFIFNNVSQGNAEQKAREMLSFIRPVHYPYVAQYIVVKRASMEANFHGLYLSFLQKLGLAQLTQQLVDTTYENVKVLLTSDKVKISSSERSLLKNLGSWLGLLTISKNRPIAFRHLDLKSLVLDAYERGRLIAVIPFVAKILETAKGSIVFMPPNPWTMAMMQLLCEIYGVPDLKLNLKFEIEVLCKHLNIKLEEVPPSNLLSSRVVEQFNNPDFTTKGFSIAATPAIVQPGISAGGMEISGVFGSVETLSTSPQQTPLTPPVSQQSLLQAQAASESDKSAATATAPAGTTVAAGAPAQAGSMPFNIPGANFQNFQEQATVIPNLAAHVMINHNLPLFIQQPLLKRVVVLAVDRAIREIITPVVERSVTIACITTRELCLKDFAMEPDENKMRKASHMMVQTLAGSLALVTCKEPLRVSMGNHLRSLLQPNTSEQALVEQVVQVVSAENLDLGCMLIEKAATEKAVRDIDDALAPALSIRRKHREQTGQPYYDMSIFSAGRYPNGLPEPLRPKHGGLTGQQMRVYEDFVRIPRQPVAQPQAGEMGGFTAAQPGSGEQATPMVLEKIGGVVQKLEYAIGRNASATLASLPQEHEIQVLLSQMFALLNSASNVEEASQAVGTKLFKRLFENVSALHKEVLISALCSAREANKKLPGELTSLLLFSEDDRKYNKEIVGRLFRGQLLVVEEYMTHLVKALETYNVTVIDLAMFLVKRCMIDEAVLTGQDLYGVLGSLQKLSQQRGPKVPDTLQRLLEDARAASVDKSRKDAKMLKGGKPDDKETDPPAVRDHVAYIFQEWLHICSQNQPNEKACTAYLGQLVQHGAIKDDEGTERFFRILTDLCIAHVFEISQGEKLNYRAIDAYSKLVALLCKYCDNTSNTPPKIQLLTKIINVIVRCTTRDFEVKKAKFNQRPYYRLFANLLTELNAGDSAADANSLQILGIFSNAFHALHPSRAPAFAFSWLELLSHRMFMPKLLMAKGQKGWPLFHRLIVDMFKFLEPYLRNTELNDAIRMLYKGLLRVLLLLLHDFPEFLCDFHFSFCDVIPPTCIQMRNLILSAFPRNMRLPDPFTPNLKVDLLPEISQPPRVLSNYTSNLSFNNLKHDLDSYLKSRSPVSFLIQLQHKLLLPAQEVATAGTKFNVPVINALVLYVGTQAIAQLQHKSPAAASPITHSAPIDVFQQLAVDLDTEGRYLFLNAIANQLRYPNNHTHYFSCVLLYLFAEAKHEILQEQITRVLLERLIVHRPHPWGLLITFIELIKNPRYNFWSHNFVRCAADIERLFEHVARSCMGHVPTPGSQKTDDEGQQGESTASAVQEQQ